MWVIDVVVVVDAVGTSVGSEGVGVEEGWAVGVDGVGTPVGTSVGLRVGVLVGPCVGTEVVGPLVGALVGTDDVGIIDWIALTGYLSIHCPVILCHQVGWKRRMAAKG